MIELLIGWCIGITLLIMSPIEEAEKPKQEPIEVIIVREYNASDVPAKK